VKTVASLIRRYAKHDELVLNGLRAEDQISKMSAEVVYNTANLIFR